MVPTPIGNLEDITLRALRVLRDVDLVLAEDTRQTRKLFSRYEISTPLQSYHQHNKMERIGPILARLKEQDVALVSNAGTPAVSDPGFELLRAVIDVGIPIEVLPGPSAVITAVVASALPAPGFLFAGFLPRQRAQRRRRLAELATLPFSLVFYEAPHRLVTMIEDAVCELGDREAVVARELSKVHEELVRGPLSRVLERYRADAPRGECTLVVAGAPESVEISAVDLHGAIDELLRRKADGERRQTAMEQIQRAYDVPRSVLYQAWVEGGDGT